jgi:hypothetical protein
MAETTSRAYVGLALCALLAPGCANTVVTTDAQQAERATQSPPTPVPSAPPSAVNPAGPPRGPVPAPAPVPLTAATITVDMLLDDPRGKAILARYAPAIAASGQLEKLRGQSLQQVAGRPDSGLTPALVGQIVDEFNAR